MGTADSALEQIARCFAERAEYVSFVSQIILPFAGKFPTRVSTTIYINLQSKAYRGCEEEATQAYIPTRDLECPLGYQVIRRGADDPLCRGHAKPTKAGK